jgi:hypothetical protein
VSSDPAMSRATALVAATAAMSRAREAHMKFEAAKAGRDATGQEPNQTEKVTSMENEIQNAPAAPAPTPAPVVTPAPAPVAAPVMSAAEMMAADKPRRDAIRAAAAPFMAHVGQAEVDRMIDAGMTVDEANRVIMQHAAAGQPRTTRVEVTRDEGETQIEGMIGALMHRADPSRHALEGAAMQFRGLRVKSLAMHLAGGSRGFNEVDTIRTGLRSTSIMSGAMGVSDFAYITTEVMGRTLRAAYERRLATWRRISRQRSASDFRELHSVMAGGDFELKATNANGEYLQSTVTDEAQGLKLAKYGRQINLTFEAIVNDDMGVFERLPGDFARAAATLESKIVWSAIRGNAKVGDGKALFHNDHGNTDAAGNIDVANVGAGRKAMWEQRPAGSKDKDDFIAVSPDLLFVPPALETQALQFVAATVATKGADANPFAGTLTPVVEPGLGTAAGGSDANWYLFASDLPTMEHAYLDGYEAPTVVTKEGLNPDGVNMVARHIFAAVPVEFRGAYRRGA